MTENVSSAPITMTTKALSLETGIPNSVIKKAMKAERLECRSDRKGSYVFMRAQKEEITKLCLLAPADRKANARAEKMKKYDRLVAKVEAEIDLAKRGELLAKARKQSVISEEKLEEMLKTYCGTDTNSAVKGKKVSKTAEVSVSA